MQETLSGYCSTDSPQWMLGAIQFDPSDSPMLSKFSELKVLSELSEFKKALDEFIVTHLILFYSKHILDTNDTEHQIKNPFNLPA